MSLGDLVRAELLGARRSERARDIASAWRALEQAHVLSQPLALLHTRVHWRMLWLAVRTGDPFEALGQLPRLAIAGIGSLTGRYPVGNTGRSNVSMFRPMPISNELRERMRETAESSDA